MTDFRGPRNVQLGFPVWAGAQYDPESRDYVVSVEGDDVERFRAVADLYGFREGDAESTPDEPVEGQGHERHYVDLAHAIDNARDDEPEPPHDPPADDEGAGDDDAPDPEPGEPDDESTDDTVDPEPTPEPEPKPARKRAARRPR